MKTALLLHVLLASPALADVPPGPGPDPARLYGVAALIAGAFVARALHRREKT